MDKKYYPALDETLFTRVLPNGLRILINKKPGFSKKTCHFAVNFGSIHRKFSYGGKNYTVPAGIAHYLEHKLFDMPDREVSAEFASLGAQVNGFTSYDMTDYHISCTEHFPQVLQLLLEFVSTPYFTAESVAKEQGIIAQEIGMNEDEPGSRIFENLTKILYFRHPVRFPILGTLESVSTITPELLTLCHNAFYTPENMVLCVVGDVDEEEVCRIARSVLGDEKRPCGLKAHWPQERPGCNRPYIEQDMEVAMPMFSMAFKTTCPESGEAAVRREMVGELAAEALFGESSPLYMHLYEQGLIDTSFGGGFDTVDGCAMLSCSGDSESPQAVQQAILQRASALVREGIPQEYLLRMKRSAMGRRIRDLDSFNATCFRLCAYDMSGFDYFSFPALYDDIDAREIQDFLAQVVRPSACSLSVINPIKEDEP